MAPWPSRTGALSGSATADRFGVFDPDIFGNAGQIQTRFTRSARRVASSEVQPACLGGRSAPGYRHAVPSSPDEGPRRKHAPLVSRFRSTTPAPGAGRGTGDAVDRRGRPLHRAATPQSEGRHRRDGRDEQRYSPDAQDARHRTGTEGVSENEHEHGGGQGRFPDDTAREKIGDRTRPRFGCSHT